MSVCPSCLRTADQKTQSSILRLSQFVCLQKKISMGNQNSEVAESFLNLSLVLFEVLTYFLTSRYQHFRVACLKFLSLPLSSVQSATIGSKIHLMISESVAK